MGSSGKIAIEDRSHGNNPATGNLGTKIDFSINGLSFPRLPSFNQGTFPTFLHSVTAQKVKTFIENILMRTSGRLITGSPTANRIDIDMSEGGNFMELWLQTDLVWDRSPQLGAWLDTNQNLIYSHLSEVFLASTKGIAIQSFDGNSGLLKLARGMAGNDVGGFIGHQCNATPDSTTYVWPNDGASGRVLSTDGAGVLSWIASGGGGGGVDNLLVEANSNGSIAADTVVDFSNNSGTNRMTWVAGKNIYLHGDDSTGKITIETIKSIFYIRGADSASQEAVDILGSTKGTGPATFQIAGGQKYSHGQTFVGCMNPVDNTTYKTLPVYLNYLVPCRFQVPDGSGGNDLIQGTAADPHNVYFTEGTGISIRDNGGGNGMVISAANNGTVTSIDVAGGTALSATGGPVTASGTITLKLDDTSVSAGTYGSATKSAVVAIDAQGRITSASEATISGGGGMTSFDFSDGGNTFTVSDSDTVLLTSSDGTVVIDCSTPDTLDFSASGGGGGMTSFDVDGDSGPAQTIENGNTLNILGGTDLASVASATDTVTLNHSASGVSAATYGDATHVAQIAINAQGHVTSASEVAISGGGGGMTSFDVDSDSGSVTIEDSDTLTVAGGTNVTTAIVGDTLTINSSGGGGGGVILQVLGNSLGSTSSTTDTSYATCISQAITPDATSNKVLIGGNINIVVPYDANSYSEGQCDAQLFRDSTEIGLVKTIMSDDFGNMGDGSYASLSWNYLDSPNTTSSVTYYIKYKTYDESTMGAPEITLLDAQITVQEVD